MLVHPMFIFIGVYSMRESGKTRRQSRYQRRFLDPIFCTKILNKHTYQNKTTIVCISMNGIQIGILRGKDKVVVVEVVASLS